MLDAESAVQLAPARTQPLSCADPVSGLCVRCSTPVPQDATCGYCGMTMAAVLRLHRARRKRARARAEVAGA